jgi:putative transposase
LSGSLNHVLVLGEAHLCHILARYVEYCHQSRTHLALDKDAPDARPVELSQSGRIVEIPEVGGLQHRYIRRAA